MLLSPCDQRGHIAQERLDTLIMRRWIALASAPQQRYVPPKQGCVKIQVMEKIVLDGGHRPLSQTKVLNRAIDICLVVTQSTARTSCFIAC